MANVLDIFKETIQEAQVGDLGKITFDSILLKFDVQPIDTTGQQAPPGVISGFFGKLVKPKVTIQTPFGNLTAAPYGEPPAIPWVGYLVAVGILVGVIWIAVKLRKP